MTESRFRFNAREWAGAVGDLGTLLPLVVGFIAVCGLDGSALFIYLGICNILCGLVFRVPMPLQPMKLIAVAAIAGQWSPAMLYACGIATGIIWTILGLTRAMTAIGRGTPVTVVNGIQAALGILLAIKALELIRQQWLLALLALLIIIACRRARHVPAALVLVLTAATVMWLQNSITLNAGLSFRLPFMPHIAFESIWDVMVEAGFAQIPLTAANAVIATAALARLYWPENDVTEKKLSLSIGLFNLTAPLCGGIPVCHGAGGLAAQYAFGARTCGTKIIEGSLMLVLGIFMAGSISGLLTAFPAGILGVMLLVVGCELIRPAAATRTHGDLALLAVTLLFSLLVNVAVGFLLGVGLHAVRKQFSKLKLEKNL
jgi:MFS superfamily sulfate permease-like transporter